MTIPVRRKRGIVVKKATALRPSLLKNMKSRQTLAAQAIFKRARQTAAIAAKVAADAAALVSPSYVACMFFLVFESCESSEFHGLMSRLSFLHLNLICVVYMSFSQTGSWRSLLGNISYLKADS